VLLMLASNSWIQVIPMPQPPEELGIEAHHSAQP
jgi:hypothetical protein